jgi:hypothetical protein
MHFAVFLIVLYYPLQTHDESSKKEERMNKQLLSEKEKG